MSKRRESTGLPEHLKDVLRDRFWAACRESGRAGPRAICNLVRTECPNEIEPYLREWGYSFFVRLAAQEFKSFSALSQNGTRQAVLPGLEQHLSRRLPPLITVPTRAAQTEDEYDHVLAEAATPSEWRAHRDAVLRPQRDGLTGTIVTIDELLERGDGCPDDDALLPWLSHKDAGADPEGFSA